KGANEKSVRGVLIAKTILIDKLKQELPNIATYHAIGGWLQAISPELREALIFDLLFQNTLEPAWEIDDRIERFIEDLLGPETWQALCALQDDRFWKFSQKGEDTFRAVRGDPDTSTSEYQLFRNQLKSVQFEKHDWQLALAVDSTVADSKVT